jgi:signal transduction histidine kinase/ActR/RegA family two-component response regulator
VALLLVAALVPLIVFAIVATFVSLRSERAAEERDALARARRISALVDAELQSQLDLVAALARLPSLDTPADVPAFAEMLQREQAAQPLWLTAMLADPDGNVLAFTDVPRKRVVDIEGFRQVVRLGVPLIGNIARGTALALPVRAPVLRDGQVRFVVVAALRPDAIRERMLTAEVPAAWTAAVADKAGRLVARTHGDESMLAQMASPVALAARSQASSGIFYGQLREGVPNVAAFYVSPTTGWTVYIAIPRPLFDAPLVRATWLAAVGGAVCIALAASFLTLLLRELRLRRRESAMLETAQRLEALGRLTGGVAHDFNNLLAVVSGNLELLERRLPGAAGHRSIAAIRGAVDRGVSLTRGLLTFSRSGLGQGTVEDVNACIRGVFGMMRETVGPNVEAELDLHEPLPPVMLDRVQLDLALLNLAANARDAMPRGGVLRIATRPVTLADGVAGVAMTVADTGVGIPADILSRVFEPFFTTKEIGRGTGLGLAQVYGFARNAGGTAEISSTPGAGTSVSISLPATAASVEAMPQTSQTAPRVTWTDLRILLVDDNAAVRELTAANLREHFSRVDAAADATEALALLDDGDFAAVVCDIIMPDGMDGIGLAREIRRRWPAMPVILVSGYAASAGDARALGVPVLLKPLELARLVDAVRVEIAAASRARSA